MFSRTHNCIISPPQEFLVGFVCHPSFINLYNKKDLWDKLINCSMFMAVPVLVLICDDWSWFCNCQFKWLINNNNNYNSSLISQLQLLHFTELTWAHGSLSPAHADCLRGRLVEARLLGQTVDRLHLHNTIFTFCHHGYQSYHLLCYNCLLYATMHKP